MKDLISAMLRQLYGGERVVLCSILESSGSTPRGAGAKLAVLADGSAVGTVGGGVMEHLAIRHAAELLQLGRSETKRYSLHPDSAEDIGMVCGGEVLLGFQCLFPERAEELAALTELKTLLDAGSSAWLKTEYYETGGAAMTVIGREDIHSEGARLPTVPVLEKTERGLLLTEPVSQSCMTYVFGGGHVSAALVPALAAVGFPVTVYDSRPALAVQSRFPQAKRVICGSFEDILSAVQIRPEDYVVIMTPGHMADFQVLSQVLKTDAAYIGCIGSKKKVAYINDRLRESGFTDADIQRVHAPIGLPILAQTPEEIAVSITAQMIYHRHGGR